MPHATAEEAALAGWNVTPQTRIVAVAAAADVAAVLLDAPSWPSPDRVICRLDDGGWEECGSGSGRTSWSYWGDGEADDASEEELGVLVCWGEAEAGARAVRITFHGQTAEVPVTNGYWIWMVDGIREAEMDDPAEFEWLYESR